MTMLTALSQRLRSRLLRIATLAAAMALVAFGVPALNTLILLASLLPNLYTLKAAKAHDLSKVRKGLGVTAFACTPDAFPDLMAAAIERRDITQWAQQQQQQQAASASGQPSREGAWP